MQRAVVAVNDRIAVMRLLSGRTVKLTETAFASNL